MMVEQQPLFDELIRDLARAMWARVLENISTTFSVQLQRELIDAFGDRLLQLKYDTRTEVQSLHDA